MKQKVSRGLCGKVQNNVSFKRNGCEADRRAPPIRFENSNGENRARRHSRGAVVPGGDPRRCRGIGEYLRDQCTVPRLWVVVEVVDEHHVDGGPCSGGRRFGQSGILPEGAAGSKLTWGLTYWRWYEATGESRAAEEFSPERTLSEPESDGGGRSQGRKAPRGPSSG